MQLLNDVRVLDFGRYIAGPFCAALLGDLGADVIRIATSSLSPVIHSGNAPRWGTNQVFGPGQDNEIVFCTRSDNGDNTSEKAAALAATRIKPLSTDLRFIANNSCTACSLNGLQLRPHTPSAGQATTSPAAIFDASNGARHRV